MTTLIQTAADLATPWADLYGGSVAVQSAVTFVHFSGLLAAGGFALAADGATLRHSRRGWPERLAFVRDLAATHRVVIPGLVLVVLSGVLLLAADVEALLPAPVFWAKMGAFVLLLLNGLSLRNAGRALAVPGVAAGSAERGWRALRAASLRSATLWFVVLLLGTLLTAA